MRRKMSSNTVHGCPPAPAPFLLGEHTCWHRALQRKQSILWQLREPVLTKEHSRSPPCTRSLTLLYPTLLLTLLYPSCTRSLTGKCVCLSIHSRQDSGAGSMPADRARWAPGRRAFCRSPSARSPARRCPPAPRTRVCKGFPGCDIMKHSPSATASHACRPEPACKRNISHAAFTMRIADRLLIFPKWCDKRWEPMNTACFWHQSTFLHMYMPAMM